MDSDKPSGERKGLTPDDYRAAVQEHGSMQAAARALDVSRPTVRDMCVRHDIEVPSIGRVPEQIPSRQ